jgi:hypothetical protein
MIRALTKRLMALLPFPVDIRVTEVLRNLSSGAHRKRQRSARRALRELGDPSVVMSGSFRGMRYAVRPGAQGGLVPKLLGSYEKELTEVVELIIARSPATVIDIGAADGYYAVGFAFRLPAAHIIAFEMEKPLRGVIDSVARSNGVRDRIDVRGACSPAELEQALAVIARRGRLDHCVVMCDVEGYEDVLLDPSAVTQLRETVVLCEIHDLLVPGVGNRIRQRFETSHEIRVITSQPRTRLDVPASFVLSEPDVVLHEGRRSQMEWLLMSPRGSR